MTSTTTTASAVRSMARSPRVEHQEFAGGPWNSMVLALLLVLPQAQAFVSSPASHGYHAFRRHTAASLAKCCTSHPAADGNSIPRRHAQSRKTGEGWPITLFGCVGRGVRSSSRSKLWMANPEGTQQLRDRDLEFMFYDEAQVYVRGGSGGAGAASFRVMAKKQRGQANGGSGGRGGDVTLVCESSLNTLVNLRGSLSFVADPGKAGLQRLTNGKDGGSVEVSVPPGTVVRDKDNGGVILGELREEGERLVVAKGGHGGRGNAATKISRGQAPKASSAGSGERRWLALELRLVADVGLVGVPSAGKSTLLAAATNAKPKIADYPFTTLVPNLGVCDPEALGFKGGGMVLADIPGLLEGAHKGVGLGRAFLRHVERCRAILHVVSGASPDPVGDFRAINQELALFSEALALKPQVVVLNKIDLPEVDARREELEKALQEHMGHTRLMAISSGEGTHVSELMRRTRLFLDGVEAEEAEKERLEMLRKSAMGGGGDSPDEGEISEDSARVFGAGDNRWIVRDTRLVQMSLNTDWDYYGAVDRFLKVMESLGVLQELREEGALNGDIVLVGEREIALAEPPENLGQPLTEGAMNG